GGQNAELVAFPGLASGSIAVRHESRLQGAQLNYLCNACCTCNSRLDVVAGFQFLDLHERLGISEDITVLRALSPDIGAGTRILVRDEFDTRNQFYGGQLGLRGEVRYNRLFVNSTALL